MKSAVLNTRKEKWTLCNFHPWIELQVTYETDKGISTVEIYGFDGNSIDITGESIEDGSYKEKYPYAEEILKSCDISF